MPQNPNNQMPLVQPRTPLSFSTRLGQYVWAAMRALIWLVLGATGVGLAVIALGAVVWAVMLCFRALGIG